MNWLTKTKILDSKPRKCFFAHAGVSTGFTYLTSGVFLSGLAILMGAGDVLVSYLSVIINICGVMILAFAPLLERFRSRKKLTIGLTVLSRAATLFIVLIPVLFSKEMQLYALVAAVVIAFTLQAQTTVVLNQWMISFVDEKKSGRYISLRQTLVLTVTVLLSIAGGWWMDSMNGKYLGFVFLFCLAAVMGAAEVILLILTPDSEIQPDADRNGTTRHLIYLPLKNRPFMQYVIYITAFYFLLNVADSFTMVYLMKYLALPYKTVTAMYMIISLPQVFLLGIWGRISDKRGHEFVLKTSVWLFTGETLFMFFASPNAWFFFVPLAFLIASAANAGFVVAVFNRRYELIPAENRIVYDNFYTASIGLGFILGPMAGGLIKNLLERIPTVIASLPFAGIRLLYLVSTAGILVLQIIYLLVRHSSPLPPEER